MLSPSKQNKLLTITITLSQNYCCLLIIRITVVWIIIALWLLCLKLLQFVECILVYCTHNMPVKYLCSVFESFMLWQWLVLKKSRLTRRAFELFDRCEFRSGRYQIVTTNTYMLNRGVNSWLVRLKVSVKSGQNDTTTLLAKI